MNSDDKILNIINQNPTEWSNAVDIARGKRILIATSMALFDHAAVLERLLSIALTLRGARVDFLLCDGALPACQMTKFNGSPPEKLLAMKTTPRCQKCVTHSDAKFDPLGLKIHKYSDFLTDSDYNQAVIISNSIDFDQIREYTSEGEAIGEHAYAGALRYYGRGDLDGENDGEAILRRFFRSALISSLALNNLYRHSKYDIAVFHHGIYTPQGIIGEVSRKFGIHVVNWNASYRKNTFIFSHNNTYHHTMIDEPIETWIDSSMDSDCVEKIDNYLLSRRDGSADWIWFHEHPENNFNELAMRLGIDLSKPCIGMLTSVVWDAQLHYKDNAFPSMLDWVLDTIEYFRGRPDLQLLLRIHPAEIRGMVPSRQKMFDEIHRIVSSIPNNVIIISPENQASTYALMDQCDSVIIYNTKTGIELAAQGIPVIVAGEAWVRNKGFTFDAKNPDEYHKILDNLPMNKRLSNDITMRAKKYAHHFFYGRMIDLPFISSPEQFKFEINVEDFDLFRAGGNRGLDIVCNGILNGEPFIQ